MKIPIGTESSSVGWSTTGRTIATLLARCLLATRPPLGHLPIIPRVACSGTLNIFAFNVGLYQLRRSITIHQYIESVLGNLLCNQRSESAHEFGDKCRCIYILLHIVLGLFYESIAILNHRHVPLVKQLKIIDDRPAVVGIKVGFSRQVLKCPPVYALGIIGLAQGLPPCDGGSGKSMCSKGNMILHWCLKSIENPLDGPKRVQKLHENTFSKWY